MNCSNCKHWGKWTYNPDLGSCRKVVRFWEAYEWHGGDDGKVLDEEQFNSRFFVSDNEDYFAALFTRPDFGCTEHEGIAP